MHYGSVFPSVGRAKEVEHIVRSQQAAKEDSVGDDLTKAGDRNYGSRLGCRSYGALDIDAEVHDSVHEEKDERPIEFDEGSISIWDLHQRSSIT